MKAPAGLQKAAVVTSVALVHAVGLWALLGHDLQPAASAPAPQVMMLMLIDEPAAVAAAPAALPPPPRVQQPLMQPQLVQARPPQPRPAPPRDARPVAPKRTANRPPPVPAAVATAEAAATELPLPSSETAPAVAVVAPELPSAITVPAAARSAVEGQASAPVQVAKSSAKTGVTRRIEDVDYLRAPVLEYPSASRRYGEQGRVVLRVLVGTDGQAEKIELHEASAFQRLNEAAIEAARRALYKPYTEDGVAQPAWALVALSFQLRR